MTYLSFYRLVKSMKRQIFYRLTEILSFYAFLRPDQFDMQHLVPVTNCVLDIYTFWIGFSFRIQGDFQSVVAQWEVHLPLVL